ncbi:polysaccharide biosynthesis tyrosine autokinase [Acidipropionibacterium timonense]|uniref:polysaccharide biosynthesis tyrosine autokinase n=1 Tax=Acidipropionibacterium timonense TaxID=2161818 RepID=UPI0010301C0C|nr:polysaccharide biosynthesis tyrosine autokinase [Acidipropionibacterium timonense]
MQLRSLVRNMSHLWRSTLVVFILAAVAIGAVHYATTKPSYQAEADVIFTSKAFEDFASPDAAAAYTTSLVTTYSKYLQSVAVLDEVGNSISPTVPGTTLAQAVTFTASPMMLSISYTDGNQDNAQKVVQALVDTLNKTVSSTATTAKGHPVLSVAHASVLTAPVAGTNKSMSRSAVVGLVVGLLVALLVMFLRALISTKVRDLADVSEITDASVLGVMPAKDDPRQADALGRNLSFIAPRDGRRTVLIAPSIAGEPAAATALAAADALARTGASVALVDADLHAGEVTRAAGLSGDGLSEVLAGRAELRSVLPQRAGATLVPAGSATANGAELLSDKAFDAVLADLAADHDTVIVAGPAMLAGADSFVMAPRVAAVVPVIGAGKVSRSQLQQSLETLALCHATVGGVVLTGVTPSARVKKALAV